MVIAIESIIVLKIFISVIGRNSASSGFSSTGFGGAIFGLEGFGGAIFGLAGFGGGGNGFGGGGSLF